MAKRNAVAVKVDDLPFDGTPAGHFKFIRNEAGQIAGMFYACPCGCGAIHGAIFPNMPNAKTTWAWDGNEEKPTLTPSLGLFPTHREQSRPDGLYHWHGWLRAGVFEEC